MREYSLAEFSDIARHGFLPANQPRVAFPDDAPCALLDQVGQALPDLLEQPTFRKQISEMTFPDWDTQSDLHRQSGWLELYYLRLGFIASAYVNQVGYATVHTLPANIAQPLCRACQLLQRPPILSYDGYALYNWHLINPQGDIALGNIDTIQNFVHLYDEHWFILVHVEIEAIAADIFHEVNHFADWIMAGNTDAMNDSLMRIAEHIQRQKRVLQRIPEKMDPALYFKTFRPYIRFFENVRYAGTDLPVQNQRGETGAQSSIMPALVAFMKIPHKETQLTSHLMDMRHYMPLHHRHYIHWLEDELPDFKSMVSADAFNAVLQAMAEFRQIHYGWAEEYINKRTADKRGTGGTPYMQWLKLLIDETLAHRK